MNEHTSPTPHDSTDVVLAHLARAAVGEVAGSAEYLTEDFTFHDHSTELGPADYLVLLDALHAIGERLSVVDACSTATAAVVEVSADAGSSSPLIVSVHDHRIQRIVAVDDWQRWATQHLPALWSPLVA